MPEPTFNPRPSDPGDGVGMARWHNVAVSALRHSAVDGAASHGGDGRRLRAQEPRRGRRPLLFVAWGSVAGRSAEIAASLGGEARCFFPLTGGRRPPVLVRYAASAVATAVLLVRRRPRVVVVTNPPVPAALVTFLLARLVGAAVVLDSHPGGFGAQGDAVARRLQWVHRQLVRRASCVAVTDESWCERVRAWGGRALVLHEAPGDWTPVPPEPGSRLRVLVVSSFSVDEPTAAVLDAARRLPDCDFLVTGNPARCPRELLRRLPTNVRLVGFLDPAGYREALVGSDAVLTLTTEPTSVMRAAYEAVYACRPLIVSDWPLSRRLFPSAIHAANDAAALVSAVERLRTGYWWYAARLEGARAAQLERWDGQRRALLAAVDGVLGNGGGSPRPRAARRRGARGRRVAPITLDDLDEAGTVARVVASAARGRGGRMSNLNVDILRLARADPSLHRLVADAELVLADGTPIVWAARLAGTPLSGRVPASEAIWPLCEEASRCGVGVFLLGGSPGTAERAALLLSARFPALRAAHLCPPLGFERSPAEMRRIATALEAAAPGIVFCGLGSPKQERLMAELHRRYPSTWFVACGGTFAMVCGELPKAPPWMRRWSLEWLHRLRLEPRRLFSRYVVHDLPFSAWLFAASAAARLRVTSPVLGLRSNVVHDALIAPRAGGPADPAPACSSPTS